MLDQPTRDPVMDLLDSMQRETKELMAALCQVQSERIRDLLARDLRDHLLQVVDERFSQIELSLRPRMARARLEVARGITQVFSECFARMRRFESDRHWCEALLDALGTVSRRSAFFSIRGDKLCFQGLRGMDLAGRRIPGEVPIGLAPAFKGVIETAEPATASRSAAELSEPIAQLLGGSEGRALLVPLRFEGGVPGVIYVEDPVDPSAIHAIAAVGAATLEKFLDGVKPQRTASPGAVRAVAVSDPQLPESSPPRPAPLAQPASGELDSASAPARRFAQVQVARMILECSEAVARGRSAADLYNELREPIDKARDGYRTRFHGVHDFLHEELVRTLARSDSSLLGRDYPGPLS
jgi:hypothetical protein